VTESLWIQEHYDGYLATQEARGALLFSYLLICEGCTFFSFFCCMVGPFPMQFFLRGFRDGAFGHPGASANLMVSSWWKRNIEQQRG
jgi:hypothetical protein